MPGIRHFSSGLGERDGRNEVPLRLPGGIEVWQETGLLGKLENIKKKIGIYMGKS